MLTGEEHLSNCGQVITWGHIVQRLTDWTDVTWNRELSRFIGGSSIQGEERPTGDPGATAVSAGPQWAFAESFRAPESDISPYCIQQDTGRSMYLASPGLCKSGNNILDF